MDVPYNKSGASSRAHYQLVMNVESNPADANQLLQREVDRIKRRFAGKSLSLTDIAKDLVILMYCYNTSTNANMRDSVSFGLPPAAHLAESGSLPEKRIGYIFCLEVMTTGHELQLMLVNTIRKDLFSAESTRIFQALNFIILSPTVDQIPAVQSRCIELFSHHSPRLKKMAMKSICSLSRLAPEVLLEDDVQHSVQERLTDADEGVVKVALETLETIKKADFIKPERVLVASLALLSRSRDKNAMKRISAGLIHTVLDVIMRLSKEHDHIFGQSQMGQVLESIFVLLRRATKHNRLSIVYDCFRTLGCIPITVVALAIEERMAQKPSGNDEHPVAIIRHFISSRSLNDIYFFLSCLSCLDPTLWAGEQSTTDQPLLEQSSDSLETSGQVTTVLKPVLDQWEVERILSTLETEDDGIRELTLGILVALDARLVESCYVQAMGAMQSVIADSKEHHIPKPLLRRTLEIVLVGSLKNGRLTDAEKSNVLAQKLKAVTSLAGPDDKVLIIAVEMVLNHVRKEKDNLQRAVITQLVMLEELNSILTIELCKFALVCELAPSLQDDPRTFVDLIKRLCETFAKVHPDILQPAILSIMRLALLLTPVEVTGLVDPMEHIRSRMNEVANQPGQSVLSHRFSQLLQALDNPTVLSYVCKPDERLSLPEFARRLDQGRPSAAGTPASPFDHTSQNVPPPSGGSSLSSLSIPHSKLRYDAYAPPPTSPGLRTSRLHSFSSMNSSSRTSSRMSTSNARSDGQSEHDPLAETVTPGDLALGIVAGLKDSKLKSGTQYLEVKGEKVTSNATSPVVSKQKQMSNLIALDSPFLSEPLVDADIEPHPSKPFHNTSPTLAPALDQSMHSTASTTEPYVSASTSLRSSFEGSRVDFAEMWEASTQTNGGFRGRGWSEDTVEHVMRRLHDAGMQMDVLAVDDAPFEGDLKIMINPRSEMDKAAFVRLHEEDDGTCLWQLRSLDETLAKKLKGLL